MGLKLSARVGQLITLVLFFTLCAVVFSYLWVNSGGKLPGITKTSYQVTAYFPRVANLVYFGDVMVAGVKVGKVQEVSPSGDQAKVVMNLDGYQPLHQGASAQVRAKTLIEESFVEITDGTGPALPSGTVLPRSAAHGPTELNDVLVSLSGQTREALAHEMRSLGAATEGSKQSISDAMAGLGALGRGGYTALDALNAQSEQLKQVTGHTATMLAALNTQHGEIAQLVEDSNRLFTATADGQQDLAETIRTLPPVLASARDASDSVTDLGNALWPVARNLDDASPDLTAALHELPDLSHDLRDMLPDLRSSLHKAPDTLHRVHPFSRDTIRLVPKGEDDLASLNPILGYLKPYGKDMGGMLANIAQTFAHGDANGNYFASYVAVGPHTVKGLPLKTSGIGGLGGNMIPYMKPGGPFDPMNSSRPFTRLEKESPGR
jgi:phospholipid/cholesterol/gamma-HCH transport system substrate-binding protein